MTGRRAGCCPTTSTRSPTTAPWVALLPVLDPTVMGWKSRGFYLDPGHVPHLFDTNGNAGTTAWVDGSRGRLLGAGRRGRGRRPRWWRRCPAAGQRGSAAEAERLTAWLDGVRVGTVYPSAAMKAVQHVGPA